MQVNPPERRATHHRLVIKAVAARRGCRNLVPFAVKLAVLLAALPLLWLDRARTGRAATVWLLLGLSFGSHSYADVPVPPLEARVTDLTATLSDEQRRALEYKLAGFEERKGSQIAVLLVPTTQPETIEQYSMRVAQQWKLGRKGVDDGALLLIAKDDRALRIEVGYGLEGVLPDVAARHIVDEIIVPRFRDGDFSGGIDAGVDSMIKQIEGEPLPEPIWRPTPPPRSRFETFGKVLILAIVLLLAQHDRLRTKVGRFPAALIVSGLIGVLIWWVAETLIGAVVVGLCLFFLALLSRSSTQHATTGSGFLGLGRGGSWGGGLGGFGGGGGGFGGGGFSGRW